MPTTNRLAAIYTRVSSEEQVKGLVASTVTQVERCEEKARLLGIPVASRASRLIVEEQHSGADLRWRGTKFMALAERAARGEFTDLICLDIDRFCRGGSDAYGEQKHAFTDVGVTVHYVMTDFGSDNPFRGGMEALMADAAQWMRDKASEASVRNRTEWAKQGNITRAGPPPFGFQFVFDETRHTRRNHPVVVGYVPDPVTGPALLHITQLIADGGSVGEAKAWLEAQGIPTLHYAPVWHPASIRRILHNPTNYGQRNSFATHKVKLPDAARRARERKTAFTREPVPQDQQYPVDPTRVTPPPGLTYDLWQRAREQLQLNKECSSQAAAHSDSTPPAG